VYNGISFSPLWNFPSARRAISVPMFYVASYYNAASDLYLIFFRLKMSAAPRVYVRICDLSRSVSFPSYTNDPASVRSVMRKGNNAPSCPTLRVGLRILALSERENRHTCCCRGRGLGKVRHIRAGRKFACERVCDECVCLSRQLRSTMLVNARCRTLPAT